MNRLPDAPPVIYVTASSEISLAIEALKSGAADFVIKTAGPDFEVQLLAALERALELARISREKERAHNEAREERDRAKALLEEVNHRVANSLALVIALVRMQASATPEASAKTVLSETEARIAAVANLHRTLYASEDILVVDLDVYLRQLVDELRRAVAIESLTPTLSVHAVAARIATDKAVAIGVITTELISQRDQVRLPRRHRRDSPAAGTRSPAAGSSCPSKTMASDSPAEREKGDGSRRPNRRGDGALPRRAVGIRQPRNRRSRLPAAERGSFHRSAEFLRRLRRRERSQWACISLVGWPTTPVPPSPTCISISTTKSGARKRAHARLSATRASMRFISDADHTARSPGGRVFDIGGSAT